MELCQPPEAARNIADMREKWRDGSVTTPDYHRFIEKTKRSLSSDKVYRFF